MRADLSIRRNSDGTVTVRMRRSTGRPYVEHVTVAGRSPLAAHEAVRWAVLSAGVRNMDPARLDALVTRVLWGDHSAE